jgi:uncharacterized protein YacL
VIVEAVRFLITVAFTAVGFQLGSNAEISSAETAPIVGAVLGAGIGYVVGGAVGRGFRKTLDVVPGRVAEQSSGPELFAGAFGLIVGLIIGVVIAVPIIFFVAPAIAWPVASLVVLISASLSTRLFATRSDDLLAVTGLRRRGTLVSRSLDHPERAFLLDSSAAIDGRVLEMSRAGLLPGRMWVPEFVLDELQGLADAVDKTRRRRGRRGLEVIEAMRGQHSSEVFILEEIVPEFEDVDAKLLALALRAEATLVTTDYNLAKAAGARGIAVLNPHSLAESLKPAVVTGDRLLVDVTKTGSEPGQGVGYLDDGTMLVVEGGADLIGTAAQVEIVSVTRTSVGRMLFGRLVE